MRTSETEKSISINSKKLKQLKKWQKTQRESARRYMERKRLKTSVRRPRRHVKVKVVPLPKLKRILWKLISERVRKEEPKCVSCGGKNQQAGHYIKKSICNLEFQYLRQNIHSQCIRCNVFLHGNLIEYRKWMVNKYGEAVVKEMEEIYKYQSNRNPREFIQDLIDLYANTISQKPKQQV
jgi:hypothetical protein